MGNTPPTNTSHSLDEKLKAETRAIEAQIKRENEMTAAQIKRENEIAAAQIEMTAAQIKRENEKAATSIKASDDMRKLGLGGVLLACGIVTFVAADHFVHAFRPFVKWRVRRSLKKRPPPINAIKLLPNDASRADFIEDAISASAPTVLVGATGCGKSTLLKIVMQKYYSEGHGDTKLISIRESTAELGDKSKSIEGARGKYNSTESFHRITKAILSSIDYPLRRSYLQKISGFEFNASELSAELKMDAVSKESKLKLEDGLSLLIECASDIYKSTGKRPMIVFDEFHDLIRDNHFSSQEAVQVFGFVANKALSEGMNEKRIKFLFAASSSVLSKAFNKTLLSGSRRRDKYIKDYSQQAIVDFFTREPYNVPEGFVKKYTDRVGTRLRDLEIFVERATAIDDIDKFIEEVYKRSRIDVHPLMLNPALRKYFIALATETPVLYDSIPQNLKNIPEFSKAFYVNGLYVEFQNEVVKKIWIEEYSAQELGRLPIASGQ
jgi:energy-coupling factor transporter ATP-binding protein EcfA2